MEELIISPYILMIIFFVVALVYSSVGLGGGSSYTSMMTIFGMSYIMIPTLSLTLNLFATTVGSYNFIKNKHARFDLMLPFFITSIPMSYIGASLKLPKDIFYWILAISLFIVAARIYFWENTSLAIKLNKTEKNVLSLILGAILGLISGISGIGGGIYLIPLIIILKLGTEKEAATCGVLFIWFNSLAGVAARLKYHPIDIGDMLPFIIVTIIGSSIGSHFGSTKLSPKMMQKILGVIILFALFSLIKKLVTM